jgi:hypothetical protein
MMEYKTARYPTIMDLENHLNELSKQAVRSIAKEWRLHSFAIDSRDGSVVAVLYRT